MAQKRPPIAATRERMFGRMRNDLRALLPAASEAEIEQLLAPIRQAADRAAREAFHGIEDPET